jgi:hypothetical protein
VTPEPAAPTLAASRIAPFLASSSEAEKARLQAGLEAEKAELEDQLTTAADGERDRIQREIEACKMLLQRLKDL